MKHLMSKLLMKSLYRLRPERHVRRKQRHRCATSVACPQTFISCLRKRKQKNICVVGWRSAKYTAIFAIYLFNKIHRLRVGKFPFAVQKDLEFNVSEGYRVFADASGDEHHCLLNVSNLKVAFFARDGPTGRQFNIDVC